MNEVFLEGTVASMALVEHTASAKQHCICQLRVVHQSKATDGKRAVHHQCLEPSGSMGSASAEAWDACVREGLFDAADTAERCRNGSNGESLRNSAGNTCTAYSNACAGIAPRNCLSSAGSKPYQHWRWICNQPKHYRQRSEQPYQSSNDPSGCAVFSKKT